MCVSDWQVCAGPTGGGGWVSTAVSVCALLLIIGVPLFLCVRGIRGQLETLPPPRGEIEHAADDCLPSPYYQSGCAHEELQLMPMQTPMRERMRSTYPDTLSGQRLLNWS